MAEPETGLLSAEEKRARLRKHLEARAASGPAAPSGPAPAGSDGVSPGQRALWFLHRLDPGGANLHIASALPLPPAVTPADVRNALDVLVRRHPQLRAAFPEVDGEPVLRVAARVEAPLEVQEAAVLDIDGLVEAGRRAFEAAFDIEAGPAWRAHLFLDAERGPVLLLVAHHIVSDTMALTVMRDELLHVLDRQSRGLAPALPPLTTTLTEHVGSTRPSAEGPEAERLWAYWRAQFPDGLPRVDFGPPMGRPGAGKTTHGFLWHGELIDRLDAYCSSAGVTQAAVLLAAYGIVLQRLLREDVVPVGTAAHGRDRPETQRLVGYLANPVLLNLDLRGAPTFTEWVGHVGDALLGALAHEGLPFASLVERLEPGGARGGAGIDILFVHQRGAAIGAFGGGRTTVDPYRSEEQAARVLALQHATMHRGGASTLALELYTQPSLMLGAVAYDAEQFTPAFIERFTVALRTVLEAALRAPDDPVAAISLLAPAAAASTEPEAERLPPYGCIHTAFARQVERAPEAIAVEDGDVRWTYAELDARADALAAELTALEAADAGPIALALPRSPELVAAMLAALKAGAPYLPLDLKQPAARTERLLEEAGVTVLISHGELPFQPGPDVRVLSVDARGSRATDVLPPPTEDPERAAYVMFTSGSTGTPKGVVVPHRAVTRLVCETDYAPLGDTDRVAHHSNVAFDASTFEVWGALLNGGCVVILEDELTLSPRALGEAIRSRGITTVFLTTALFNLVAREAPGALQPLRWVLFGGEAVDADAVAQVLARGAPEALLHVYGPTEGTTFSTWHRVRSASHEVPIGRAVRGTTAHVVDAGGHPVPDGFIGELVLGGAGIALGYLQRPGHSESPFVPEPARAGERTRYRYRTGDLVRRNEDGDLVYIGRTDRQVKVRGYRVEPGEIETVLRSHPDVAEAIVDAVEHDEGDRRLHAYVVMAREEAAPAGVPARLRAYLGDRLPEYMLPSELAVLEALPLNANGKVDRVALRRRSRALGVTPTAQEPAQDDVEARMHRIFCGLLRRDDFGREGHFFDLGGHSLLVAQLAAEIERDLGVRFPLRALLEDPTVAGLAALVRRTDAAARFPAVVPVQPYGHRTPLFCLPGAGGSAAQFALLSRHLGADQPLFAIEARGRDGTQRPHRTVKEMTAYVVEALREVQPSGPYALLGYSAGGLVAYEVANELKRRGEEVAFLAVIDTANPGALPTRPQTMQRRLGVARGLSPAALARRVAHHLAFRFSMARDATLRYVAFQWHLLTRRPAPEAVIEAYLFGVHRWAFMLHRPQPFDGPLTLLRTDDHPAYFGRDLGWELLVDEVVTHHFQGDHLSVLHEPEVGRLAATLRAGLGRAARRP